MSEERVRYFTPSEANEALPAAVTIAGKARSLLERGHRLISDGGYSAEARKLEEDARALLAELGASGVEMKGVTPLLLDFPALRYGTEVYLCWREGEHAIDWWHPIETGIGGRQPLRETEAGAWEWCN